MGSLFTLAMSPITMLWTLMERHIWTAVVVVTAITAVAFFFKAFLTVCLLASVVAVLFMRMDAISAEPPAA